MEYKKTQYYIERYQDSCNNSWNARSVRRKRNYNRMLNHKGTDKLETNRLLLRQFKLEEEGKIIGNISVVSYREDTMSAILGYCLGSRWWGNGIMPEAAKGVLTFLFEEVGFHRIAADHDKNNPKSGRVMQKIGMKYEGTLRKAGFCNQGIIDEVWYSILKEEWFQS